jgi:TRAP-type C4-dicarboxylate transport system substrate-binding protein
MIFKKVFLGGIAVAATLISGVSQAQEFKLNYGHYLNDSPFLKVEQEFAAAVEARSGGRVSFNIVYSGGLGKGNELLPLAGRGAIDVAAVVPGYYADQMPFARIMQTPFVFDSPSEAIDVAKKSYSEIPAFAEELDGHGVMRLFHQPLGSYFMTGKTDDCKSLDGLAGKKIRTFGADLPKMMEAVGAVPTSVGFGDIYEAVDRGTLDYSFLNLGNVEALKLNEVGTFNCGPALSMAGHLIVIGKRTWNRLPADIQQIILEEASVAQDKYVKSINDAEAAAEKRLKAAGATVIRLTSAQMADWKSKTPDLMAQWAEGLAAKGQGEAANLVVAKWAEWTKD